MAICTPCVPPPPPPPRPALAPLPPVRPPSRPSHPLNLSSVQDSPYMLSRRRHEKCPTGIAVQEVGGADHQGRQRHCHEAAVSGQRRYAGAAAEARVVGAPSVAVCGRRRVASVWSHPCPCSLVRSTTWRRRWRRRLLTAYLEESQSHTSCPRSSQPQSRPGSSQAQSSFCT